MRQVFQSFFRFTWSMSLFGLRQVLRASFLQPGTGAAFDEVTAATRERLDGSFRPLFDSGDHLQRGVIDFAFGAAPHGGREGEPLVRPPLPPPVPPPSSPVASASTPAQASAPGSAPAPAAPPPASDPESEEPPLPDRVDRGQLDVSRCVVLGEGLAAGMGDFALSAEHQRASFPAQAARRMRASLELPLLQAPGVSWLPGFPPLPVRLPGTFQTTVFADWPPEGGWGNLAVPGFTLADALERRPAPPLVRRRDPRQTAANLILGIPDLMRRSDGAFPTQLERALARRPTFALVELGYAEALEAATQGNPAALPDPAAWRAGWSRLLGALRGAGAEVLVLTVPDPLDTAHFAPPESAARVLRVDPSALASAYGLTSGDRVTLAGLLEIAGQLFTGGTAPLPERGILRAATAEPLSARLRELNDALAAVADEHGARVCDLHALFRSVRGSGVLAGRRVLTADFLGGFYGLNGYYPGRTGQAAIANSVLQTLNESYGADFPAIDLARAAALDAVAQYRLPDSEALRPVPGPAAPRPAGTSRVKAAAPAGSTSASAAPAAPAALHPSVEEPPRRLQLPPGLEQVLPLARAASYHGDAIRIVDARSERDRRWGTDPGLFFGGHVMYDSHLEGSIRIRFAPPQGDRTRFEIFLEGGLEGGLAGDDGMLAAPWLFRWPVFQARVTDAPGFVSAGVLDLATGEVSDLQVHTRFLNSALFALTRVNPHFPDQPISFPGQYGSAWARFDPRPDGLLDFTFYGSTFLPLGPELGGEMVRWALPFASGDGTFASMPARGMAMHPHLHLSTREPERPAGAAAVSGLPANTVEELTLFTRNSSFGDKFTLHSPDLGGEATGRSHVMGRLEIQFGERFGDALPVLVSALPPGGLMLPEPDSPLAADFPGRLQPGPIGHDEFLRFPLRKYFLDSVAFLDDPFDVSVGAVDLRTGRLLTELLHRGFIGQNLFYALVRVEPRTPRSSFLFRGPAAFAQGPGGETVFRLNAAVRIPYPPGFYFPEPDLATRLTAGPGSVLDPFLWIRALTPADPPADFVRAGEERDVLASTGDRFSYRYSIPADPARQPAAFEYVNHSQGGTFRLHSLAWVGFFRSLDAARGEIDTVTFAGFGSWSKDPTGRALTATVQIADTAEHPYISIQIEGGLVSNVNTKPVDPQIAFP